MRSFMYLRIIFGALVLATTLSTASATDKAAAAATSPANKSDAQIAKEADAYMQAQAAANHFSGAVLISRAGKTLFAKGYGPANAEWNIPNTPQTRFRVGSITKQFTATLVMQLQRQGKLNVTDALCKYVDPCPATWSAITIHHLLSHTSGVPSYTDVRSLSDMAARSTNDKVISLVRDRPLDFTPGDRYKYSNSGYFLLGMIIEKVSGQSYESMLTEHIFKPLGMNDSGYDHGETVLARRASGYRLDSVGELANADHVDMSWPFAAGALYSTVEDLEKWNKALYVETVLPKTALQTMWTPVKGNYGYGWMLMPASPTTFNKSVIAHSGGINGFSAFIARYVDDKTCVIVLSNLVSSNTGGVATALAAVTFGESYVTPKIRKAVHLDDKILSSLVGEYRVAPTFSLQVTVDNGHLFTQATNQRKLEAFPESETEFFLKALDAQFTFVKDGSGKVTQMILHQNGRDAPAMRTN